jgi:uncharacterized protein YkwD
MTVASRVAAGFVLAASLLLVCVAPAHAAGCRGADARGGSPAARGAAMRCLVSHARVAAGRPALRERSALDRAATAKAALIGRCRSFSHTPCGTTMAGPMRRAGYARGCYSVGENLAWVTSGATPRQVLKLWLASPAHRANLLNAGFRDTGIARRLVTLPGAGRVEVWVEDFGARC